MYNSLKPSRLISSITTLLIVGAISIILCSWIMSCTILPRATEQNLGIQDVVIASIPGIVGMGIFGVIITAFIRLKLKWFLSDLEQEYKLNSKMALEDSLTGIGNRRAFSTEFPFYLDASILYMDLDRFKEVNDMHGHAVGDDLLRQVAARILETKRPQDLAYRVGGDEFVLLMPGASLELAQTMALRVRTRMRQPFRCGSVTVLSVDMSIGVADSSTADQTGIEDLWKTADRAMYVAKEKRAAASLVNAA